MMVQAITQTFGSNGYALNLRDSTHSKAPLAIHI